MPPNRKVMGPFERLHKRALHLRRMQYEYNLTPEEMVDFVDQMAPEVAKLPPSAREHIYNALTPHPAEHDPDLRSLTLGNFAIDQIQRDPDMKYEPGIIAQVVEDMTPGAQGFWKTTMDMVDTVVKTGRIAPFQRVDVDDMCKHFNVDEGEVRELNKEIQSEQVQGGLLDRMGTDSDRPDEPISMRETISAAVDHHEGGSNDGQSHDS